MTIRVHRLITWLLPTIFVACGPEGPSVEEAAGSRIESSGISAAEAAASREGETVTMRAEQESGSSVSMVSLELGRELGLGELEHAGH